MTKSTLRRTAPWIMASLLSFGGAKAASADLLSFQAEARGGVHKGKGMFGNASSTAFQEGAPRSGYGVLVGAELFFVDMWIQHDQFLKEGKVDGTWTQFMLGGDIEIPLGEKKSVDYDDSGKASGGYSSWYLSLGMGAGFAVGTGQQVDPPLDNSEVTDKGFLFEGKAQLGYRLTQMFSLGLTVPVQFGYFTKSGPGTVANSEDNHYAAMDGAAMLTFRTKIDIK